MDREKMIKGWQKKNPKGKAMLAWDLSDYEVFGDEPPACVFTGVTEGEAMSREQIEEWVAETISILSVLREEYPDRYKEQFECFVLDLEYLKSLGKITQEERDQVIKEENYKFGQE